MRSRNRMIGVVLLVGVAMAVAVGLAVAQGSRPNTAAPEQALSLEAVMGTWFTYQGRLMDNGRPANGTYDFRFKLYDAQSGGTQVGNTLYRDNIPVQNGLFSVTLDFGSDAFTGEARWLEVAVRPGGSTGNYTRLTPRQPILAVPYALSLRPGAVISSTNTFVGMNYVVSRDGPFPTSTVYGLYAKAEGTGLFTSYYGVYGSGTLRGVYGYSANGYGVYAKSSDGTALGVRSTGDGALIEAYRGDDTDRRFLVDNDGTLWTASKIQSAMVSRVFVPGNAALPHSVSRNDLELRRYGRGTVDILRPAGRGDEKVIIPISLPAVLYGQPTRIKDLRVHYSTSNAATYIDATYLYRQKLDGGYYTLIGNTTNRTSTTFTYYHLNCTADTCRLGSEEGFLTVTLHLHFADGNDRITLGGVRITLEHD